MATLYVRQIPDRLYKQARKLAAAQGSSLSAFVASALEQAVEDEKIRAARSKALAEIRRTRFSLPPGAPASETVIRRMRDSRA
jgi:plasmid stability protein